MTETPQCIGSADQWLFPLANSVSAHCSFSQWAWTLIPQNCGGCSGVSWSPDPAQAQCSRISCQAQGRWPWIATSQSVVDSQSPSCYHLWGVIKQYLWMVWVAWTFLPHHQGELNLVDWQHLWNAWFKPSHIHSVHLCEHGSPSFPVSSTRFLPLRENLDHAHSCLIVCSFQCPHVAYSRTQCQIALTWMSYHVCGLSSNHATEVYHQELRKAFHFGQPVRDLYGHLKLFCGTPSGKQVCWQLPQSPRGRNK